EKAASAIRAVTELFLIDTAENPTVTKEEETHYVLNTGDGDAIRLVKYEKRWEGLWENYFTIDADADTGAVYYFYASSFPLQTLDSFQNVNGVPETLNEMLTAFAALTGLEMSGAYVKTGQVTYTQAFSDGESTVTYDIYFSYVPAKLLDVKMTIRGG
ncbi:MAG: hypothetical protein FWC62_00305, partial [Firmicutes bacterium]|nr:hypothetical protein [Bacillota bacterium]